MEKDSDAVRLHHGMDGLRIVISRCRGEGTDGRVGGVWNWKHKIQTQRIHGTIDDDGGDLPMETM